MSKNVVPCGGFELGDSLVVNDGKLDLAPGAGGGLPTGGIPGQFLTIDEDNNVVWKLNAIWIFKNPDGSFDIYPETSMVNMAFQSGYQIFFIDNSNDTCLLCSSYSAPGDGNTYLFFISPDGAHRRLKVKEEISGELTITEITDSMS